MNTINIGFKIRMTKARWILLALFFVAFLSAFIRYYVGLGTTHLSDAYPWGFWILFDLSATAFASVGFSMTLIAKIFHRKKYEDLVKRSLLIAFLTYVFVMLILIIEVGRWDNFWRPLTSPGISSPMFGVLVCMMSYLSLMFLELIELFLERYLPKLHHKVEYVMPLIMILACSVPLAYQANLGSLYFAMDGKLDALWATRLMPIYFILSAFFIGPVVAILENIWSAKRYNTEINIPLLHDLSKISAYSMIAFAVLKISDIIYRGQLAHLFTMQGIFFMLELATSSLVPAYIVFSKYGKSKKGLTSFGLISLLGLFLIRGNIIFTGMFSYLGVAYFPGFIEITTTIGFISFVVLLYMFITENFSFFGVKTE